MARGAETHITISFAGKDYQLLRATWPDGSAALVFKNPATAGVSPVTLPFNRLPRDANEAFVPEAGGLLKTLEEAGIVKRTAVFHRKRGDKIWLCQVVHRDLIRTSGSRDVQQSADRTSELSRDDQNTRER